MRAHVKQNRCIGCGLCALRYPGLFEFDEALDAAKALPVEILGRLEAEFREAAARCPARAIRVADLPVLVEEA